MQQRCYVYVLRSLKDKQFCVGFTKNLSVRVTSHQDGLVPSTKDRLPLELVYWEGLTCSRKTDPGGMLEFLHIRKEFEHEEKPVQ